MKQIALKNGFINIIADGGYQFVQKEKADIQDYSSAQTKILVRSCDIENWIEIPINDIEAFNDIKNKEQLYKQRVSELIHERYDIEDEIAIINNRYFENSTRNIDDNVAYMTYRQECKDKAKKEIYNIE